MANSLGALVVRLGLDAVDFVDGLTKSERQAQKFAERLKTNVEAGAKAAGAALTAMVAGATAAAVAMDQLVKQAADFQDLAEETNASAEAIASFAVSAAVAGVEVSSVAGAMNKLTKNLVGVDDESKAAGAALKALGINVEDFKKLDPAAQYEAIGQALSGFEDNANKTAVAIALFGKSGAEQLKVFKALEEAGGRQVILTAEQIRQADEYADRQAKNKATLNLYAQAIVTQALPVLTALTEALSEAAKEMLGLDEAGKKVGASGAVATFAEEAALFIAKTVDAAANAADAVLFLGKTFNATASIVGAVLRGEFSQVKTIIALAREDGAKLFNNNFADRLEAQFARNRRNAALRSVEDRGFTPATRPALSFSGAEKADKAQKERTTEAERYLENLQRQLDKTRELNVEETLLAEVASGRLKIEGKVTLDELVNVAKRIDAAKEEVELLKLKRNVAIEAGDAVNKANEKYQAQLDKLLSSGPMAKLEEQRKSMLLLAEALDKGRITAEQFSDAATGFLGLNQKMAEGKTLAEELGLTFSSAFEDAIVGGKNLSEVLKGLEQDILRIVTRKFVTEPLSNALGDFLKPADGGGIFGGIGSIFSSLFGGGRAIGGPVDSGRMYEVNERGPELLDVNGRQFLMMGSERGKVTPMRNGGGMSVTNVFHLSGPVDRRTQQQIAASAAAGAQRAMARNR